MGERVSQALPAASEALPAASEALPASSKAVTDPYEALGLGPHKGSPASVFM